MIPFYDGQISQYSKKRFVLDGDGRRMRHQIGSEINAETIKQRILVNVLVS